MNNIVETFGTEIVLKEKYNINTQVRVKGNAEVK